MEKLAPICLFTYNRLEETKQTIAALQKNNLAAQSELFIFSDGGKDKNAQEKVQEVREFLKTISGFKKIEIIEAPENKGLANSIIAGVTQIVNIYDKVIVLEDDLITAPNFLDFMNQALQFYSKKNEVYAINGYSSLVEHLSLDSFYSHSRSFPWGWATWRDRWHLEFFDKNNIQTILNNNTKLLKKFKSNCGEDASKMLVETLKGSISSWYIRWVFHNYLLGKTSVFPVTSKVQNIGDNEAATHYSGGISAYLCLQDNTNNIVFDFNKLIVLSKQDYRFLKYFSKKYKLVYRIKLIGKKGGIKKIINEFKTKFLK